MKKNEMDGACSMYAGKERCVQDFGDETWGKEKKLGKPRCRWNDNIKIDIHEVEMGE
jgi:hypothetical protein